jgi:arylsulfatase
MKKHTKIFGILIIVAALLLISIFFLLKKSKTSGISRDPGNHYNVIVIVSDALRQDVLGCYGGGAATPNIDRLAKNGMLFENAYSTAPCTLPSSVSILTGNYSRAYTIIHTDQQENQTYKYAYYVNDNELLLAEALKETGFDVLTDVENDLARSTNNFQGFSQFRTKGQMKKGQVTLVENTIGINSTGYNAHPLSSKKYYGRLYDLLHYLLTVPKEQNFFLLKWYADPHAPYNPAGKFKQGIPFNPGNLPQKENFYTENFSKTFRKLLDEKKFSANERLYLKELYKAEIESVDERVGYIVKALETRGLLENTFVVFTSDHGELFGEYGWLGHGNYYHEPLVRIPLIIAGPGIPKGKREKTIVSHLDLMPTLKDLLGVRYAHHMKGKSYKNLFHGKSLQDRIPYFDRISNDIREQPQTDALLMKGYKLIVDKKDNQYVFKLFNITDDPGETIDISPGNQPMVQRMFKIIQALRKDSQQRLKSNLANLGKGVNLEKENRKTMELLKTLGYIESP